MARFLIPVVLFVALIGFLAAGLRLDPTRVPSPLIDKPAPAFSLPRLRDANRTLSRRDLLGKVSLVNVWATWCGACYAEHPVLVRFARHAKLPIYGLNLKDERAAALGWLQDYGNPYSAVAFDKAGRVAIDWGVYGAPETFVVDRNAVIRYKHIGPLTAQVLRTKIMPLVRRLREQRG